MFAQSIHFEILEPRQLLATVTVSAGTAIRSVDTKWLGVNTSILDSQIGTTATSTMTTSLGTAATRWGGSSIDNNWHFNINNKASTIGQQASFIATHGNGFITVNYGTASPQEAAAELAYLNGSTTDNTTIGTGEQWNATTSTWVDINWGKVSDWAKLRAAAPLAIDDGKNFLRINHAASFAFHYWGIGNEIYGTWETDHHGAASDHLSMPAGTTRAAHDATTIVSFAKQFQTLANEIDPTISIGIDAQGTSPNTIFPDNNFIADVLTQANASHQNFKMGFLSDHLYDQNPGSENDTTLLNAPNTVVNPIPSYPLDLAQRAAAYRQIINTYYGQAAGASMETMITEVNSTGSNPGKQMTSLVNGLFIADTIGSVMETEFNGAYIWQLQDSWNSAGNNAATLYGWRQGGSYGFFGSNDKTALPAVGLDVAYPSYFAEQLASKIIQSGGTVVSAASNDPNLDTFAVMEPNGHLELLVINKSKTGLNNDTTGTPATNSVTFNISGFSLSSTSQMWRYGSTEDNAQKNSTTGAASLTHSNPTLTLNGSSFTMAFPSLSMSVIDLTPKAPTVVAMAFPYNTAPNKVQFTFDQGMLSSSITASDLMLINQSGGTLPTVQSVQWDSASKTATFILTPTQIPVANFTATLPVGSVSSAASITNPLSYTLSFYSLPGDANHDRTVNLLDLNALATNFGKSNMNFTGGDFDYNGVVGLSDFNQLVSNFGKTLSPPSGSSPALGAILNAAPLQAESIKPLFADTPIAPDLLNLLDQKSSASTFSF
jgi:hypothetical protein